MAYKDWDNDAIEFTLSNYQLSYSTSEIHSQLVARGYRRLRLVTVEQCLRIHGHDLPITQPIYYPEMGNGIIWNEVAHDFTWSAYLAGYSPDQITQQLMQAGYNVVLSQVVESLQVLGVQVDKIA